MAEKIIIASGKGGAGKTSLATGVAMSLASKGKKVLVIDFDIGQSCIDFMLGGDDSSVFNWGDAVTGNCEADKTVRTASGVSYITAPLKPDSSFDSESIRSFIENFEENFDFILFDSPAGFSGGFSLAVSCAERALIVSTPDEICTKAAHNAAVQIADSGIEDIRLVINRFDKKPTVKGRYFNIDEVIDAVNAQLIGVVPEDKAISYASSTGFSGLKDCPAKAAYGRIADRLCGARVNLVLSNSKKEKPKSKVPLYIIAGIIIAVVIAVSGIFAVDCVMTSKRKPPVFAVETKVEDNGEIQYRGLFYTVKERRENDTVVSSQLLIKDKVVTAVIS